MKWATRAGCHIDRAACAWLIRRFIDPQAEFLFVEDPDQIPEDATAFDVRGALLSHHGGDCTFERTLAHYDLDDPALVDIGRIVHEADLADERYDAPEAPGLDVVVRGMSMLVSDQEILDLSAPMFDGLYEYRRRSNLLGRETL
ncbi:MAG: chromate resistance protein ChrB domain-containing protein [Dehalococcoidia bacterium]